MNSRTAPLEFGEQWQDYLNPPCTPNVLYVLHIFHTVLFLNRALNDEISIGIHYVMFLPTIEVGGCLCVCETSTLYYVYVLIGEGV